jgi:hypothetical protein
MVLLELPQAVADVIASIAMANKLPPAPGGPPAAAGTEGPSTSAPTSQIVGPWAWPLRLWCLCGATRARRPWAEDCSGGGPALAPGSHRGSRRRRHVFPLSQAAQVGDHLPAAECQVHRGK